MGQTGYPASDGDVATGENGVAESGPPGPVVVLRSAEVDVRDGTFVTTAPLRPVDPDTGVARRGTDRPTHTSDGSGNQTKVK